MISILLAETNSNNTFSVFSEYSSIDPIMTPIPTLPTGLYIGVLSFLTMKLIN